MLNETESNKLPDAEFKTMVIRMLKGLSENLNSTKKDRETIKKNQSERKGTVTEMKNNSQGINRRIDEAKTRTTLWNIRKQKAPNQNRKEKKRNPK